MDGAADGQGHSDALVLFGITGDLAKKKLFPAVYHMAKDGTLPSDMPVVGVSSSDWTKQQLCDRAHEAITASLGDEAIDDAVFSKTSVDA